MAKLTISRAFEAGNALAALSKAKIEGLEDFVTYLSDFSANVIDALRGTLTIRDNLQSEIRAVQFTSGVPQRMQLQKNSNGRLIPVSVLPGLSLPYTGLVTSLRWQMTIENELEVTLNFTGTPTILMTLIILY